MEFQCVDRTDYPNKVLCVSDKYHWGHAKKIHKLLPGIVKFEAECNISAKFCDVRPGEWFLLKEDKTIGDILVANDECKKCFTC